MHDLLGDSTLDGMAGRVPIDAKEKGMNRSLIAAIGLVLALSGCATADGNRPGFRPFAVKAANVAYASVAVVNDKIVVSQEPIYVQQSTENTLYWYLDPTGPYYFPDTNRDKGIEFIRPIPGGRCKADPQDNKTFVCTYVRANKGKYPYMIKVTRDGTTILNSDPTVFND